MDYNSMFFEFSDGSHFKVSIPGDGTLTFDGEYKGEPAHETVQLLFTHQIAEGIYMVAWREQKSPAVVTHVHNFNDRTVFSSIVDTVNGKPTFLIGRILFGDAPDKRVTSNDNV